jgi:transposase
MRIISIIAAFALATVVCADVITSNSGVADATSLQTRRLRGEVHIGRIRRPVDGSISSDDESTSAEAPTAAGGGDQVSPIRKRKHIPLDVEYASEILVNLKNAGNGDDTASSTETRPNRQKQKGQLSLNDGNPEKAADVPIPPRKTFKKSTVQERQAIELFLRHRMKTDGSLPLGTIAEAARHFGRDQSTISRIHKELKPNSADERGTTEQERQDIVSFLRQRMNAEGTVPYGTNIEAAKHFGRHESIISRIYKNLKPKSDITKEQERQNIVLFLRQRMTTKGSLPFGTISEAARHFGRHRNTIERIYMEIKPNTANERSITEQERQDITFFLRQRMKTEGSLPTGTISDAAKHFGRHWNTIERIYKKMIPKSVFERGAHINEKTIVPT